MKSEDKEPEMPDGISKKQIVLVVDGRPMRHFYTSIFLQRLKYHVIMAKTAEDGFLFMELTVPLVVIVNIDLPDLSGLELLKRVKKNRRTRDVPVIVYTSNKDARIEQECEQAGCACYLRHPASLDELYHAVQKATEKKPRRFVRLDTYLDVTMADGSSLFSSGSKANIAAISEIGMFVSTNTALPYGSTRTFTFFLPNAAGWVIKVDGQVVHNHSSKDAIKQPGIGVKFVKIGDQEKEFIREFIKEKMMEGLEPV
jgi:CheY-like chemotaxis protein/Tfp pilus assembly protein PilZ